MNKGRKFSLFFFALAMLFCLPAFAWDCSVPGQIRIQVPNGTVGNGTGDGNGQVVTVQGITFQCVNPPASNNPPNAVNTSSSSSSSNSSATGGNSSSTSSATGGNSSSNQTQKQGQTQSNSSTNNNQSTGGSVSDVGNSQTTVEAPKIPVNTAEAPPVFSTANCFKGFSAAGQTAVAGLSFGGGGIDKNCAAERIAQDYFAMGNRLAACKVIITTKASKDAHVTLQDCLNVPERRAVVVAPPVIPSPSPISVTVNVPPAPAAQILPILHETMTVTATAAQVRAAQRPIVRKKKPVAHVCPVTPIQQQCAVKQKEGN